MAGEMSQLAKTKLGSAINAGDTNKVRNLISGGENALYFDKKGNTYLHYVCTMHRPYIIHLLIKAGIDINAHNKHGHTALHITALQAEPCHVPDLMAAGINPHKTDNTGRSAKQLANGQTKWLDLYSKYEPGLRQAVIDRDIEKIMYLLHCWSACHLVVDKKDMRHLAASLTYHDIVAIIDQHRFSIRAVYAVLTRDHEILEYAISRPTCDVDYLQLLHGSRAQHMLQHAIRQNDYRTVDIICDAGANVNLCVHVNQYFRGPLYFEALRFGDKFDARIVSKVLASGVNLSLKDEKGRSALHYVIDRRSGPANIEAVEKLLAMGISISHRDENGCTARDIAIFERRKDIIEAIDQHLIDFVRATSMTNLNLLAINGYDSIIIDFQYRDTWILANGNTNKIVTKFVEELPEYEKASHSLHRAIENQESVEELQYISESFESESFTTDMLLQYHDKGGRNLLMKAILYGDEETVEWLLDMRVSGQLKCTDNIGRGILHYINALGEDGIGIQHLLQHYKIPITTDFCGLKDNELDNTFISGERKKKYGMPLEIDCAKKYAKMTKIIRSNHRTKVHFDRVLKDLKIPVAKLPVLFHKIAQAPLMVDYTDLLFDAMDHNKIDIALKLAFLGVDCSIRKPYFDVLWEYSPVWLTPWERATHLGLQELATEIEKHGSDKNYWRLGVKIYVQMYMEKMMS